MVTSGVPFNHNSDTLNKLRFSLDDLAGNTGFSPVYNVRLQVPLPNPDLDRDNDVDQSDFGRFQLCMSGDASPYSPGCFDADMDMDHDVDAKDVEMFLACMRGADVPVPTQCIH